MIRNCWPSERVRVLAFFIDPEAQAFFNLDLPVSDDKLLHHAIELNARLRWLAKSAERDKDCRVPDACRYPIFSAYLSCNSPKTIRRRKSARIVTRWNCKLSRPLLQPRILTVGSRGLPHPLFANGVVCPTRSSVLL